MALWVEFRLCSRCFNVEFTAFVSNNSSSRHLDTLLSVCSVGNAFKRSYTLVALFVMFYLETFRRRKKNYFLGER